jgi:ribosomal protein S18 acetylase RimI-like enzyme
MQGKQDEIVTVRRIRPDEALKLRALRLRALADAPYAFSTTVAEAERLPEQYWQDRIGVWAAGELAVTFVAVEIAAGGDEAFLALAGGSLVEDEPGTAELVSMWVDPLRRREGLARRLVEAVSHWARQRGAGLLRLWVTETNIAAIALYRQAGFSETGARQPFPPEPSLQELAMHLRFS